MAQDDKHYGIYGDNSFMEATVSPDQMKAHIEGGILRPIGDGLFSFTGGAGTNNPRYVKAQYDGNGYRLTAINSAGGNRLSSLAMDNGVTLSNLNGLTAATYNQERPIWGGIGSLGTRIDSAGNKSIGVNFNKRFD